MCFLFVFNPHTDNLTITSLMTKILYKHPSINTFDLMWFYYSNLKIKILIRE